MNKNTKAQIGGGLIAVMVVVIVGIAVALPTVIGVVDNLTTSANESSHPITIVGTTGIIVRLMPLMLAIAVVVFVVGTIVVRSA